MIKPQIFLAVLIIIVALGTVGIVSAIGSATEVHAASCRQQIALCHGCEVGSQDAIASEGKCVHKG